MTERFGRQVVLHAAPQLLGSRIVMFDYRPGERRLQRFDGPATDMPPDEMAVANAHRRQVVRPDEEPPDLQPDC